MATSPLSAEARQILGVLVEHIRTGGIRADDPRTYLGYKEVHEVLGLPLRGLTFGVSLARQGLEELAYWTRDNDLPAISGLIVDKSRLLPSYGYFELFGRNNDDFRWWRQEIEKALIFDWSPYL